jgi:hypothetical protein
MRMLSIFIFIHNIHELYFFNFQLVLTLCFFIFVCHASIHFYRFQIATIDCIRIHVRFVLLMKGNDVW